MKGKIKTRPWETVSCWDKQGFGGYPGVKHTAKEIVKYIPVKPIYVEPFAGLGRTAEKIRIYKQMILNDKSEFALKYLRKHFRHAIITEMDFEECILLYDSKDTVFLIDPPWKTNVYTENDLTFCDREDKDYYNRLFELCPKLKGEWIILSDVNGKSGKIMKSKAKENNWYIKTIESRGKILLGRKAKTLMLSNKPFNLYRPDSVGIDSFL